MSTYYYRASKLQWAAYILVVITVAILAAAVSEVGAARLGPVSKLGVPFPDQNDYYDSVVATRRIVSKPLRSSRRLQEYQQYQDATVEEEGEFDEEEDAEHQ